MESLLANYGSDEEEDEPPPRARAPLFSSLPPPKLSVVGPSTRSSLFASLPRPKFAGEDKSKSDNRVSNESIKNSGEDEKASKTPFSTLHGYTGDNFNHSDTKEDAKISDDSHRVSRLNLKVLEDDAHGKHADLNVGDISGASNSKRVSLFGALPPPKNTGSSLVPLLSQPSLPARSSKPVVQLRPNINMALLKDLDDEDYAQPQAKRQATEAAGSSKATGLAAILPKPKNVERSLGSGYVSGHHATLDMEASVNVAPPSAMVTNSESAHLLMSDSSSFANDHSYETGKSYKYLHGRASFGAWEDCNQDMHADSLTHDDAVQFDAPSYKHSDLVLPEGGEALCPEGFDGVPEGYSQERLANEASDLPMSNAQDPMAHILLKERRKAAKNGPPNIIEVKQTDLTAKKLREDQLRITGIAFGPAYRPFPSSKGKPSKLHRRKHQIGSLFYDMKQKEMELIERRARGNMTKAETQGKYGW